MSMTEEQTVLLSGARDLAFRALRDRPEDVEVTRAKIKSRDRFIDDSTGKSVNYVTVTLRIVELE